MLQPITLNDKSRAKIKKLCNALFPKHKLTFIEHNMLVLEHEEGYYHEDTIKVHVYEFLWRHLAAKFSAYWYFKASYKNTLPHEVITESLIEFYINQLVHLKTE